MKTSTDTLKRKTHPATLDGARVIIVLADLIMGGAQRQALQLAEYLKTEKRAEVEIWGLGFDVGVLTEMCERAGIPWRFMPAKDWYAGRTPRIKFLLRLLTALRKAKPTVILSYLITPNVACGMIWRWSGAQVCIWNQRDAGTERAGERCEGIAVRDSSYFVSNSEAGAEFLRTTLHAPAERVCVIHNGIQLALPKKDRESWRADLKIPNDAFVACMVANVSRYKDHDTLLRAWRTVVHRLAEKDRAAVLLVAGRFDLSVDPLKILAFDLEIAPNVRFLGQVEDIAGLLSIVDLGVLVSPSESSPNGALEPMAAGLAVVGSDNSGMREALGPQGERFLAAAGDAGGLADRMLMLAEDQQLREQVGATNRRRIETEFNPETTRAQMASLIVDRLTKKSAVPDKTGIDPSFDRSLRANQ